jgi:hypothetical protein
MNIGDLVTDNWDQLAIIISFVGVTDRVIVKYIANGEVRTLWASNLYLLN